MATAQDLVNQGYYGYQGWGDAAANADFSSTHGAGKGGPTNTGGVDGNQNYASLAQQQLDLAKQANAPAVSQLQSSIPNIQAQFAATGSNLQSQYAPLEQKYQSLVESIKGAQTQSVNQTTQGVTAGLGARGLLPSSAEGQMALSNTINPLNQQFGGLLGNAQAQNSSDVNALNSLVAQNPIQETSVENQVQNAIAQLQAGGNSQAIQNALQQYQANAQNALAQQQLQYTNQYNLGQLGLGSLQARISQQNANTSGGQLGVAQGQLALAGSQFALNNVPTVNDLNALNSYLGAPSSSKGQARYSLIP